MAQEVGTGMSGSSSWYGRARGVKNKTKNQSSPQVIKWLTERISRGHLQVGTDAAYALEVLKSGGAPEEWYDSINSHFMQWKQAPMWAEEWVRERIKEGNFPSEWKELASDEIERTGEPPDILKEWATGEMRRRSGSDGWEIGRDKWVEGILGYVQREGDFPYWASRYQDKIMLWDWRGEDDGKSKRLMEETRDMIDEEIKNGKELGVLGDLYARIVLIAPNIPDDLKSRSKEWENRITRDIMKDGRPPNWANRWVINKLGSGDFPSEWIEVIDNQVSKIWLSDWFEDWVRKEAKEGRMRPKWIEAAHKEITENLRTDEYIIACEPPNWCVDWAIEVLNSGGAPKEWEEAIYRDFMRINVSFPRDWYSDWLGVQLRDDRVSQGVKEKVLKGIEKTGRVMDWSEEWAISEGRRGSNYIRNNYGIEHLIPFYRVRMKMVIGKYGDGGPDVVV